MHSSYVCTSRKRLGAWVNNLYKIEIFTLVWFDDFPLSQGFFVGLNLNCFKMSNQTTITSNPVSTGTKFLKENKGALKISRTETGAYCITFSSPATGRTSFAYGKNFKQAYGKMVLNFTLKYTA